MWLHVLEIREKLKSFYVQHDRLLRMAGQFFFAFFGVMTLFYYGRNLGITLSFSVLYALLTSLACAFLPAGFISVVFVMTVLLLTFSLSYEAFVVALAMFLVMFFLYFSFRPHHSILMGISLIFFLLRIPQAACLVVGLFFVPYAVVPACFGLITGFFVQYLTGNLQVFVQSGETVFSVTALIQILTGFLLNQELLLSLIAFLMTAAIVYVIRTQSFHYARTVACIVGGFMYLLVRILEMVILQKSFIPFWEIILTLVIVLLAVGISLVIYTEDYQRVEYVEFEDDEYYYYVKAVPKIMLTKPQTKVKEINTQGKTDRQKKAEKTTEKPTEKPTEKTTAKPTEKTTQKTTEKTESVKREGDQSD